MNPTTTTRRLLLCAAVAALGACGSTPAAHFYALNPSAAQSTTGAREVALLVGPISVAQYLDRPQLARRVSAQELVFDEFHRWAEPIDQGLSRTLALDLAALLGSTQVLQFPARGQRPFEFRLEVLVTRFEQRRAAWTPPAPAMASGYWKLYIDHVLQADQGADLDFLVGMRGAAVPKDNH